jgi:hypothetical protein
VYVVFLLFQVVAVVSASPLILSYCKPRAEVLASTPVVVVVYAAVLAVSAFCLERFKAAPDTSIVLTAAVADAAPYPSLIVATNPSAVDFLPEAVL